MPVLAVAACVAEPAAAEFSGIATLTSQYIYRGQAMSDGNPALQFGLDYEFGGGLFAGVWGSTIDLQNPFSQRDTELDYYVGYHYAFEAPLAMTAAIVRYTYPGQTGLRDYNYSEALITATLDGRHSLEFGYSDDVYGFDRIGRHWELRSEWPIVNAWVISAGVGRNDLDVLDASRYLHWDLGASARFSRLTVDLRWYDNELPGGFLGAISADSQFVVSLSAAF